jgi:16S rRNA (cytosine967-C5)-methyltransferase
VKPGGRLAYATCSLLPRENGQQVDWFLWQNSEFAALPVAEVWRSAIGGEAPPSSSGQGPYLSLTPAGHGTDGFFIAILQRKPKVAA